jgi:HAD superfamily hydrolase (TIGR01509 family)
MSRVDAVFLDALGTLVELEPPWEHLRARAPGVPQDRLVMAVRAEMAYYRDHAHEGRDEASLADLRERSAGVLSRELGVTVGAAELVDAIRMRAYPDSAPALEELRSRGLKLVVVSNWDCSLGEVLGRCGLGELLDGAVSSAEAGFRKPDPRIFGPALEIAGTVPASALHVGDTPEEDLAGAEAAGIRAVLIDRDGEGPREGVAASLLEIVDYLES